jgi:hypothetical protein
MSRLMIPAKSKRAYFQNEIYLSSLGFCTFNISISEPSTVDIALGLKLKNHIPLFLLSE